MGLSGLVAYQNGERQDSIRRAQRLGRYEELANRLDVVEIVSDKRRGQSVRLADGRTLKVTTMSHSDRARLFVEGASGLEPASLWLTEGGKPMPPPSWEKVFDGANGRVSRERLRLGVPSPWVKVTPHSLRFSFALFALLSHIRAIDEHLGLGVTDPFSVRNYSQAFEEVRDLLGHSSMETTRRIYLEPVKGLRRSSLLGDGSIADMWNELARTIPSIGFGGNN